MNWKNNETLREHESEMYKDDIEAYKKVKEGLELIFEKLILVQPESPTSIVFIVSASNSYIALAWYNNPKLNEYLSTLYYLDLPSVANYCNNHKDGSWHFDYICNLGVSSMCFEKIHYIRPKVKVYFKNELQTKPAILRY
jgi:hypothetical protein